MANGRHQSGLLISSGGSLLNVTAAPVATAQAPGAATRLPSVRGCLTDALMRKRMRFGGPITPPVIVAGSRSSSGHSHQAAGAQPG